MVLRGLKTFSIHAIAQKKYSMCINALTIMLMVKIVQACLAVLVEIEIVSQIYEPNSEDRNSR